MGTDPFDATAAAATTGYEPHGTMLAEPSAALLILTCMDCRVLPLQLFGLDPGEVHLLRNAGARVTPDVLRSVLLSTRLMGVDQVIVLHHSRCGVGRTDGQLATALREAGVEDPPADLYGAPDAVDALRADLEALRSDPHLPDDLRVAGYRYDIDDGRVIPLSELEQAAMP